jgi:heptosyltransferase-1
VRILIVKLSSLGDVVHAMPVVHDIRSAFPGAVIDWVVEPGFAPLVRRVDGVAEVIDCALRRWSRRWWTRATRVEWRAFRARLRRECYDAVLDLQGLTKSALVARLAQLADRGARYGLANRTDGASFEAPARWLVDRAIRVEPRIHALDRSRVLAASALGYAFAGPPRFGLRATAAPRVGAPTLVLVHGSSRDDKLWPEAAWIELGRRAIAAGWRIALPHAGAAELARAQRIAGALDDGSEAIAQVWPAMSLDALVDRLGATQGVIGVDSGLSHIAVALDLPHVQLYNWPTAWRTGPQAAHGHSHQVSVQAQPTPSVDAVWAAWTQVRGAAA